MATQLGLYNGALREIGDRKLASLSEDGEGRRALDDVYTNAVLECLARAQWRFASRTAQLAVDGSITPAFGHPYAFEKPTDHVRIIKMSADPFRRVPLRDYHYEAGYYYASISPLFLTYVSNDASYGLNLTGWPAPFTSFVEVFLATKIVTRMKGEGVRMSESESELAALYAIAKARFEEAAYLDAMEEPTEWSNDRSHEWPQGPAQAAPPSRSGGGERRQ